MFDIGFSEIIVCAVVALVVIGPERLPETVRTVGLWVGRLKRSLHQTRVDIERQMGVDDLRRELQNEDIMRNIEDARIKFNEIMSQHAIPNDADQNNSSQIYENEPDFPDHAHMLDHEQEQKSIAPTSDTDISKPTATDSTKTT
ncbi:MAG: Sec-independent protein translocase protein TatB [Pseudomonadota bacterium]